MSRIGKKPIDLPKGVSITVDKDNTVTVKGPKGELVERINSEIAVKVEGDIVTIERPSDLPLHRSLHGLSRSLIFNMVKGVTDGYSKALEIQGVGYRAQKQGNKLVLNVGYSHPVEIEQASGIEFEVPAPNRIVVRGISKQHVGETAAKIRKTRPPEPYKGKGICYEGEFIRRKAGKAGS